ncbi:glycerophosphodiester phosphodiesterase family protein [Egicoccus sp. AB-alg6-2]|uniref:glycerophosphodiester phosphodiesterase family protein n=1 Tax=Egicoccus sp. AB-alg6-2 TaxID=3242692 RepID=UPI00359DB2A9
MSGVVAPAWLSDTPLAHRGLHGDGIPENSCASFRAAAESGYGVELDVMLARDGTPVVVHDQVLRRVTGSDRRVADLDVESLQQLPLLTADGETSDEVVPTLAQALQALDGHPAMVEIKSHRLRAGRLEAAVAAVLDEHDGPHCIASFNPATVRWFRRRRPGTVRVLTATPDADPRLPAVVRRRLAELRDAPALSPHAISYDLVGLPNPATDAWRDAGGTLVTWTVRTEADLARAREVADNPIFERVRP